MPISTFIKTDNCEWIDCENPNIDDIKLLQKKYAIDTLLMEDMLVANHLPKYEEHIGIQFFLTRENTKQERTGLNTMSDISTKLGIYLLDNTILTIHRIKNNSIVECKKELELGKIQITKENIALQLALNVLKSFDVENKIVQEEIDNIENDMFLNGNNNSNVIRKLYKLKRKTGLNMRLLSISADWVNNFKKINISDTQFFDLQDKYKDISNKFDHLNAQTTHLISLFLALSDQKANQVMKLLALYSVYFLPITFIAGVYGMNFEYMPELKTKSGYFLTLGLMALIVISTFIYFKRKKWK